MSLLTTIIQKLSVAPEPLLEEVDRLLSNAGDGGTQNGNTMWLQPGLSIYRQPSRSRYWWVRVLVDIPGVPDIRESTKEVDVATAKIKAIEIRTRIMIEAAGGIALEGRGYTVKFIADKVIEHLESAVKKKDKKDGKRIIENDYINTLKTHIIPTLGHLPIKRLDAAELSSFFDETSNRSKTRLVVMSTCIRKIFNYALLNRLLQQRDIPQIPRFSAQDKQTVRDVFDADDLKAIFDYFPTFISSGAKEVTRRNRLGLQFYIRFLINSGVRSGVEPLGIRVRDIRRRESPNGPVFTVHIGDGKTAAADGREVVLSAEAINAITGALQHWIGIEERLQFFMKHHPAKYIFRPMSGSKPQYEKFFSQLMDVLSDKLRIQSYTLYCARHTYINASISAGISKDLIASNCGNSVATIERHYEKYKAILGADKLVDLAKAMETISGPKGWLEQKYSELDDWLADAKN